MHAQDTADRVISATDFERLLHLGGGQVPGELQEAVDAAVLVPARQLPADVVTLHSVVEVEHGEGERRQTLTLCLPQEADFSAGRVSVLSPMGAALLGLQAGGRAQWLTPSGVRRQVRIERLLQPAAAA